MAATAREILDLIIRNHGVEVVTPLPGMTVARFGDLSVEVNADQAEYLRDWEDP